jgi:hypothetical protein
MEKIHHSTLKAAVAKYGPLHTEGKSAEEVKAEIAKDEKEFDEDQVNYIYDAIVTPAEPPKPNEAKQSKNKASHVVHSSFRDKDNFAKEYKKGEDVSHFDSARLEHLVKTGVVKKVESKDS